MGVEGVAKHTLSPAQKGGSALKRGAVYVHDAMNLLYSLCSTSAMADVLSQSPPVPTKELVNKYKINNNNIFQFCFLFFDRQSFRYFDRWCETHRFDGNGKDFKEVKIISVVDGRIDPTKLARNRCVYLCVCICVYA